MVRICILRMLNTSLISVEQITHVCLTLVLHILQIFIIDCEHMFKYILKVVYAILINGPLNYRTHSLDLNTRLVH